jgi:hypothetical protein
MRGFTVVLHFLLFSPVVGWAQPLTITVVGDECTEATRHVPDADVAYEPDVDVDGEPVTPADVNGGLRVTIPDSFTIPITVDLARRFGIPAVPDLYKAEPNIGTVVFRDGEAWFNGQRLTADDEAALIAACRDATHSKR